MWSWSWWSLLFFCWSWSNVWSRCNYVVQLETGIAWSTGVCIPFGSSPAGLLPYIKYSCPTSEDNDQNSIYYELYTSSACDAISMVGRKVLNATITPYDFRCNGEDGCHVSYIQGCATSIKEQQQLVMSPVDTCVVVDRGLEKKKDTEGVYSYMITCTDSQMTYRSFSNDNCDGSGLKLSTDVTDCTDLSDSRQQWQFTQCRKGKSSAADADSSGRSHIELKAQQNQDLSSSQESSGVNIGISFFYLLPLFISSFFL